MKETVVVLAISTKKEKGWLKIATLRDSWGDLGMHFDKSKFGAVFSAPGLYEVEVVNNASFGQNAQYEVTQARKIGTFEELIEMAKIK
ncbi:putative ICE protein [Streptococcus pneumoniae]|uniref:hypothetical protein n=1 Tax=Streptococcus pneumoniae TaxID=1313 RepID=UPI0005E47AA2|nr:hypothetical protein [Streptococcus pneumoniae]CFU95677.1 Uncharacterised protein [Streptococcus pneumoniae]CVP82564.1 putative ICE protein [Streptococcus pneumoniae]CVQ06680.1 putative ICE protein [Streptococcus pneumoniae]CWM21839.1 putative ICE protein [Streptococcus pneumoniae]CWM44344.1 putative ICE protein [Streptococcus pneumoniae]